MATFLPLGHNQFALDTLRSGIIVNRTTRTRKYKDLFFGIRAGLFLPVLITPAPPVMYHIYILAQGGSAILVVGWNISPVTDTVLKYRV